MVDIGSERATRWALYYSGLPSLLRCKWDEDPKSADIALIGIPYSGGNPRERSQCRAPHAIRHVCPAFCYHRFHKINPFDLCRIHDVGDVPLPNVLHPDKAAQDIEQFYEGIFATKALPLSIGGDHSVTTPILRALKKSGRVKEKIAIIHFDAHMDAWGPGWGTTNHSGAIFMHGVEEQIIDPKKTVQIGIRGFMAALDQEQYAVDVGFRQIKQDEFDEIGVQKALSEILRVVGDTPVYISVDLDALDPIYAPGVSVREANGISMRDMCTMIRGFSKLDIIGADIVCYCPDADYGNLTASHASDLLFELACIMAMKKAKTG